VLEVALGVFLLGGAISLFGALTGGFFGLPLLLALVVSAPAVGAFVEPWVERYRNRNSVDLSRPGAVVTPTPAATAAPSAPVAPVAPAPRYGGEIQVVPVVAATQPLPVQPQEVTPSASAVPEVDDVDLSAVDGDAIGLAVDEASSAQLSAQEAVKPVSFDEVDDDKLLPATDTSGSDEGGSFDFVIVDEKPATGAPTGLSVDDLVAASDAEKAAAAASEAARRAQSQQAAGEPPAGDDFTRIQGIGRSADRKLRSSGILTYAQLAAAPVELVAAVLGVGVEEVIEDGIQKQAHALAA
jgi:predicted flap endonuclease-1-like 5' DNA nuclease